MRMRTKLVMVSIVTILLAGSAVTYGIHIVRMKFFKDLLIDATRPVAELINQQVRHTMLHHDPNHFQEFLNESMLNNHFAKISIADSNFVIMISSDTSNIGDTLDFFDPTLVEDTHPDDFYYFETNQTSNSVRIMSSIHNTEDCKDCYFENEEHLGYLVLSMDVSSEGEIAKILLYSDFLGLFIILFLFAVSVIGIHSHFFQYPLTKLKLTIENIRNGQVGDTVMIDTPGELKYLANNINTMSIELKNSKEEIDMLYQKEIDRAGQLATVGELAASVAHEIRNPIAGIKSALEVILLQNEELQDKPIYREMLAQAERVTQTMWALTSFALPKELDFKTFNIHTILDKCILLNEKVFENKRVVLVRDFRANPDTIVGDAEQLTQVFINMLLNAFQSCKKQPSPKIELSTQLDSIKGHLIIKIEDNGVGIKEEDLANIYKPFFTTKAKGTGLGLSLCHSVITKHSGKIEVSSGKNKPTIFTIYLPTKLPKEE